MVAKPADGEDPAAVADSAADVAAIGEVSAVVAVVTVEVAVAARCVAPHVAAEADQRPTEFFTRCQRKLYCHLSFLFHPFH